MPSSATTVLPPPDRRTTRRADFQTDQYPDHGMCMPLQWLQGEQIDRMVVGGIGRGALNQFNAAGIRVYLTEHATAGEVVAAFKAGSLTLMQPGMACAHHRHSHGHGHGHP